MAHLTHKRFWVFSIAVAMMAGNSAWAQSQANTGSIEGTVSDPSGRSVPGASVTVRGVYF